MTGQTKRKNKQTKTTKLWSSKLCYQDVSDIKRDTGTMLVSKPAFLTGPSQMLKSRFKWQQFNGVYRGFVLALAFVSTPAAPKTPQTYTLSQDTFHLGICASQWLSTVSLHDHNTGKKAYGSHMLPIYINEQPYIVEFF